MSLLDGIGVIGVVVLIAAYVLTTFGRMAATDSPALAANLIGALLILVSLWSAFNLASVLIESAWALIALAGLARRAWRH